VNFRDVRRSLRIEGKLLLLVAGSFLLPRVAGAVEPPAEQLFQEGKRLLAERAYDRACPLLAESYRLEPETGTLLAVGMCREGENKLASARAAYIAVAERAQREGRGDRVKFASERVKRLDVLVSTLLIVLPAGDEPTELEVELDGARVARETWRSPMPVDGGEHVVRVKALDGRAFTGTVSVAARGERHVLEIPALEPAAIPPAFAVQAPTPPAAEAPPSGQPVSGRGAAPDQPAPHHPFPSEVLAAGALGAGAALLGVGSYFLARAIAKNDSSTAACPDNVCSPEGERDREEALFAGDVATVTLISGGLLAAAGGGLLVYGAMKPKERPTPLAGVRVRLSVGATALGAEVAGAF
jgi:hypothetical protein